ncbi:ParB/Srx family N-terminal domain-containing protein [Ochrobactrum sp. Marseille-Q0166]|uniref:ParB/RepB/Spo0J family partition protein n=1 Tax=Ochrobactrum sp. Marseille-Q0166 TaxID=2761105 RepID=UPI001654E2E5|nr:ParB/Srx family N-terminal domain-containing protein [Ochrobactrum sp. Marseille-Q0166]MBC8719950.1 ParB N-terminal domain-containing protein [Ochrobactrum sp. Marseille-Q0166]
MARTAKKTKAVTVATAENAAKDAEIRSVRDVAAEVVAALPAPEPEPAMTEQAETVAAEPANAPEPETIAEAATGTEIFIPLNKLKKSPRNARKTPHSQEHIEALAASIAAKGLFQNLVVEPEVNEAGEATGFYFVTIGEGRRLAQLLRVKSKEIRKTEPIRCVLDTANDPQEISLDENVTRANMHPADEFEAFRELADNRGWGAEEIAARFGISAHVVKRRLRLGAVSPKLMQVYREGDLTLDQLMAFAITDDHARQEQVFENLHYNKDPSIIRRDLIRTHVQANDRKAVFVGLEAYTEAGGTIIRDLFSEDRGGYYDDPALLDQLVLAKLEGIATDIQAEGWKWAEASIDFPHAHGMSRFYPHALELSEEDEAAYATLQEEYDELASEHDGADELPPDVAERFQALADSIASIDARRHGYDHDEVKRGGMFVTLNHDGTARIERGFIRPEDEAPEPEPEEDENASGETVIDGVRVNADGEVLEDGSSPDPDSDGDEEPEGDAGQPVSDILTRDLTAHRTLGLRLALGEQPEIALIAVTHALAAQTFYLGANAHTLEIRPTKAHLGDHAAGIEDTAAAKMLADRHAGWACDMPQNVADLWDFIAGLDHASVMALFAHCASLTVNALKLPWEHKRRAYETADKLTTALALDMSQYWTPTVSSYLGRVTKAHILEAVVDGVGYGAAERIKDKKKQEMAENAEQLLAGSGWLPPLLRTERPSWQDEPQQAEAEAEAETVADAPETIESEDPEDIAADAAEPAMPEPEASEPAGPDAEEVTETDAAGYAEPEEAPTLDDVPDPDVPEPEETAPDMEDVEDGAAFYEAAE